MYFLEPGIPAVSQLVFCAQGTDRKDMGSSAELVMQNLS